MVDTASNKADGTVPFKQLVYTEDQAGTSHTYIIHESSEPAPGWTNAPDQKVTVNVGPNNDGVMAVTYIYAGKTTTDAPDITMVNTLGNQDKPKGPSQTDNGGGNNTTTDNSGGTQAALIADTGDTLPLAVVSGIAVAALVVAAAALLKRKRG